MPIEITMPKLSDTMTDGTLVKWLKKEGDKIKPGDNIAEVETDKATQELEVFDSGTIAKIVIPEGGKTPVGGVIVVIAKPDEDVKAVAAGFKGGAAAGAAPAAKEAAPAVKQEEEEAAGAGKGSAPATKALAAEAAVVEDHDEGTERNVGGGGKLRVSPLARKIAEDKGIDIAGVRGTGPEGRIIKRDVLAAAERGVGGGMQRIPPQAGRGAGGAHGAGAANGGGMRSALAVAKLEEKSVPLSSMRQTIARRLVQSKQTIPHFYVSIDVNMDQLLEVRKSANEYLAPEKLSVTDFITRGVAIAITRVPAINSSFSETAILQHGSVDLGIAVALEDGLVVPVLRAAHTKGVRQISAEIKQLAELARSKKLKAQDMVGSTFTISNLGMYGIREFSAIVNPPESAILAVGGTNWQPVVRESGGVREIVAGQVMGLTLSADHRAVDGALGARFLAELKKVLESPGGMLV